MPTGDRSPNPESEVWQAIADVKAEEAHALMRLLVEFVKAVEADDHELLKELAPVARSMLHEIVAQARDALATAEIELDPDWLDKFFGEEGKG